MLSIIQNIPDVQACPLKYVFENMQIVHSSDKLWLEFGVGSGTSINYISQFANGGVVYGFDSFQGLPEKWIDGYEAGSFTRHGSSPPVNPNVELVIDVYSNSLVPFLQSQNKKISFVHIDCVVYSSTKFVLETVAPYLDDNCIIVFGSLVNYPGYESEIQCGQLLAFYEFINEQKFQYEWIGMKGALGIITDHECLRVAVKCKSYKNELESYHSLEPEVEDELEPEVENELEPEVENELEDEVENKLEPEVEDEAEDEAEDEVELKVEPDL